MASAACFARICLAATFVVGGLLALCAPLLSEALSVRPESRDDVEWFVRWVCLAHLVSAGPVVCTVTLRGTGRGRPAAAVLLGSGAAEAGGRAGAARCGGLGHVGLPRGGGGSGRAAAVRAGCCGGWGCRWPPPTG